MYPILGLCIMLLVVLAIDVHLRLRPRLRGLNIHIDLDFWVSEGSDVQSTTLGSTKFRRATVSFLTPDGLPFVPSVAPTWSVSVGGNVTIGNISADGLSADIIASGVGTSTVLVSCPETPAGQFSVNVSLDDEDRVVFSFGPETPKP